MRALVFVGVMSALLAPFVVRATEPQDVWYRGISADARP